MRDDTRNRRTSDAGLYDIAKAAAREALEEHHRENTHFWELIGEDVDTPEGRKKIKRVWEWASAAEAGSRYLRRGFWGAIASAAALAAWKFSGWVSALILAALKIPKGGP